MPSLPRHLRASRNVIRLLVLAVVVAFIMQLQALDRFNPDLDAADEALAPRPKAPATPAVPTRAEVNPGPFRLQIVMLERLLYGIEPKYNDGWTVEVRAKSLADSLLDYKADQDRIRAGLAVGRFAAMVGAAMDAGYQRGPRWPEWRKQWGAIRSEFFADADWYMMHDPSGIPMSSPGLPVPAADRVTARELDRLAVDLQSGIRRGRDQALKLPEPAPEVLRNTADGRSRAKQWSDWAGRWNREVDSVASRHKATVSPTADQHVVLAARELSSAVKDIHMTELPAGQVVFPSKVARRERFDSVQARVERARFHLSRIGTSAQ